MITVREVESRALRYADPQRVIARLLHRAPAHVRHLESLARRNDHVGIAEALDATLEYRETLRRPFLALVEQHLQAETDAEEGPARRGLQHRLAQAAGVEATHAIRHGALSRQHHTRGG